MALTSSPRVRRWVPLAVLALAAVGLWAVVASGPDRPAAAGGQRADRSAPPAQTGPPAPDIEIALADGGTASLADLAGQPVVLNFWASWCPPCVAEMGEALEPAHRRHGDDVAFIGVNLQDDPSAAARVVDQTGVTYELAVDPDGQAFAAFAGVGMPTTLFIDAQGRIVDHHTGILTPDQVEAQVARLRER